jgi:lipopolysaccharide transport system ATP-binding protein
VTSDPNMHSKICNTETNTRSPSDNDLTAGPLSIQVRGLSKRYKLYPDPKARLKEALHPFKKAYHTDFYALKKLSFDIRQGELVGIIGKNGSGKSTLLKIIAGVLLPTAGSASVEGELSALLELGSGFNPDFTGIENVFFYASILGVPKSQMEARLEETLAFADIGDFVHQPLKKYSSGMKARLAFAVAINVDPDILILDEVLAVGDELFRRKCYARIQEFVEAKKTILLVTHNLPAVNEFCSRALLLDHGELILDDKASIVTNQYERLLHANPSRSAKLRSEIIDMAGSSEPTPFPQSKEASTFRAIDNMEVARWAKTWEDSKKSPGQKPFLLPDFHPKTRVEYNPHNVDIFDVAIRTLHGERVNALVMGEHYVYTYKALFHIDAVNVLFGMAFKTEKGVIILTSNAPGKYQYVEKIDAGKRYLLEWPFHCLLLPGTYYTNAGVSSLSSGDKLEFMNRIVDAMAFKVQNVPGRSFAGIVYLGQEGSIKEI